MCVEIDLKKSMVDFLLKIQKRLCASLIYNLFPFSDPLPKRVTELLI